MLMSKLLLDEYPLIILPRLAVAIGLNEAIVLQQIHYWLELYRSNPRKYDEVHLRDGRYWVYNTPQGWRQDNFPFWSASTIRRALESLRGRKLLLTGCYNRMGADRTLWYSIDYAALAQLEQTICSKWADASAQNERIHSPKMSAPIPETTTETSTEDSAADGGDTAPPARKKANSQPEAVKTFRKNAHRFPAKAWWSEVHETVGESEEALELWGEIVKAWVGLGWKPTNVKGMLECYQRGEIPGERKRIKTPGEPAGFDGLRKWGEREGVIEIGGATPEHTAARR